MSHVTKPRYKSANPLSFLRVLLLPALPLLITACASNSPLPEVALPRPMPPPAPTTPRPAMPYSQSAQQNIQKWQQQLMDTPLMQQP